MNRHLTKALPAAGLAALLAGTLGGCTYDYLQRTDRVSYHAGDAVRANIERETTDPARASAYSTKGLGKNGVVVPTAGDTVVSVTPGG